MNNNMAMAAALIAVSLSIGCNSKPQFEVSAEKIASQGATPSEKAELVALAGEKLVYSPATFMQADELFDIALEKDSQNLRARFYKAMLKPLMVTRGIAKRVEGVVNRSPIVVQKNFSREKAKITNTNLKNFLMDGSINIVSEKDVQGFVGEMTLALKDARQTLRNMNAQELTLNTYETTCADIDNNYCDVHTIGYGNFSIRGLSYIKTTKVKMNFADFEALRLVLGGYQVMLGLATAYDLTGVENIAHKLQGVSTVISRKNESENSITPEELIGVIRKESSLGKLVNPEALKDVLVLGTEALEAVRLASSMSKDLCPTGYNGFNNRPGFMFPTGFCAEENTDSSMQKLEKYLRGPVNVVLNITEIRIQSYVYSYWNGRRYVDQVGWYLGETVVGKHHTQVNWSGVLSNPVSDLKSLLSSDFDACGMPLSPGDITLGGLLPKGDAADVLRIVAKNQQLFKSDCDLSSRK